MLDYFKDAAGQRTYVGDHVAFAARDGNRATLKFAEVVSIDVDGRVGVVSYKYTGYGNPSGTRVAYPSTEHMIKIEFWRMDD